MCILCNYFHHYYLKFLELPNLWLQHIQYPYTKIYYLIFYKPTLQGDEIVNDENAKNFI
jgi:hypothetical protein